MQMFHEKNVIICPNHSLWNYEIEHNSVENKWKRQTGSRRAKWVKYFGEDKDEESEQTQRKRGRVTSTFEREVKDQR